MSSMVPVAYKLIARGRGKDRVEGSGRVEGLSVYVERYPAKLDRRMGLLIDRAKITSGPRLAVGLELLPL